MKHPFISSYLRYILDNLRILTYNPSTLTALGVSQNPYSLSCISASSSTSISSQCVLECPKSSVVSQETLVDTRIPSSLQFTHTQADNFYSTVQFPKIDRKAQTSIMGHMNKTQNICMRIYTFILVHKLSNPS